LILAFIANKIQRIPKGNTIRISLIEDEIGQGYPNTSKVKGLNRRIICSTPSVRCTRPEQSAAMKRKDTNEMEIRFSPVRKE
jgi:hypothetical protein